MALPLKASDTIGTGPLISFYAVRTFVQAKNIIFFQKSITFFDFCGKFLEITPIYHKCVCLYPFQYTKNHRLFSGNPKTGGGFVTESIEFQNVEE